MKINIKMPFRGLLKAGVAAVLLLLASIPVSAQSLDTEVRLSGGRMTYQKIFNLIESEGNVWFGYTIQDLEAREIVSLPSGTFAIKDILDMIFDGTDYKYTVSGRHILISLKDNTEPEPVKGSFTSITYKPYQTRLPSMAFKSNLLYDLTTTINLGVEIGLAPRWTLDVPANFNAWKFGNDMRLRHWGLQPEARYWFCRRFDGWFMGLHGHYAQFNVGAFPDWSFISSNMQENRYEGYLYGGGISFGYSVILKKRWSMEFTLGAGYAHLVYDKYPCAECGTSAGRKTKDYFGPTKVGISLVYTIK